MDVEAPKSSTYSLLLSRAFSNRFTQKIGMEMLRNPFNGSSVKKYRRRRGYNQLDDETAHRRNVKTVRFGGSPRPRRSWRIKVLPTLRLKRFSVSPSKIWSRVKNAYVDMMLKVAGNVGYLNNGSEFVLKRVPKGRQVGHVYSSNEFESRLILEIYKSLVASRELATV
ncbi:hypothetical protein RJ640_010991 [Escallonia rubra]|uniref:Uncharacterized protein n=1 Tax=Escallonia rubra TaxID=112253 RepID=A0AA88RPJ5_9ASTE|nr:hypothetical protein RJ640_010991 [Escallonia rubra]